MKTLLSYVIVSQNPQFGQGEYAPRPKLNGGGGTKLSDEGDELKLGCDNDGKMGKYIQARENEHERVKSVGCDNEDECANKDGIWRTCYDVKSKEAEGCDNIDNASENYDGVKDMEGYDNDDSKKSYDGVRSTRQSYDDVKSVEGCDNNDNCIKNMKSYDGVKKDR